MKRARDEEDAVIDAVIDFTANFLKDAVDDLPELNNPPRLMVEEAVDEGAFFETFVTCLHEEHELVIENNEFAQHFTSTLIDAYVAHNSMGVYKRAVTAQASDGVTQLVNKYFDSLEETLHEYRVALAGALARRFKQSFTEELELSGEEDAMTESSEGTAESEEASDDGASSAGDSDA
jgi:hypothetical protein